MPDRPAGKRSGRAQRAGPAEPPDAAEAAEAAALELLSKGDIEVEGRLVAASNATLYCAVRYAGRQARSEERRVGKECSS